MDDDLILDFEAPAAAGEGRVPPLVVLLRSGAPSDQIDEARKAFLAGVTESETSLERLFVCLPRDQAQACMGARARFKAAYQTLRAAASRDADSIMAARDVAEEAASHLREVTLRALGPTSIGGLNLLARLLEDEATGKTPLTSLDVVLRGEMDAVRNALAAEPPAHVEAALRDLRGALSRVMLREDGDDLAALREALVTATCGLEAASTQGDANVLEALVDALRGKRDMASVEAEVPLLRTDLAELRASLEAGLRQGGSDGAMAADAASMVGLLERCDHLIGELLAGMDVASPLAEALEAVKAAQVRVEALADNEGKIRCVRCATHNAPDRRACGSCGAVLPVQMTEVSAPRFEAWDEAPTDGFEMTENIQRVMSAIDAFAEGHGDAAALQAEIERIEALVQEARETTGDESVEALGAYHGGLDEMGEGAVHLREALVDGSPASLERGRQAILAGAAMVQRAQRMVS